MKILVKIYNSETEIFNEWNISWKSSKNSNIFNSPFWYKACVESDLPNKKLIIVCRSSEGDKRILGILPLVLSNKFGLPTYLSPGKKYLDKSTLFIPDDEYIEEVFAKILKTLSKIGNYYLTEIEEKYINYFKENKKLEVTLCSVGRKLNFADDPYRFVNRENNRRIKKRIRENQIQFNFKSVYKNLDNNILISKEIESNSNKKSLDKDIFTDKYLLNILEAFDKLLPNSINFSFLYFNEIPICYKYGFTHGEVYHYSNTAYDVSFQKFSPGRILMYFLIDSMKSSGVNIIDFSRGDTPFKKEFSKNTYNQYTMYFYKNSIYMKLIKLLYKLNFFIVKNEAFLKKFDHCS